MNTFYFVRHFFKSFQTFSFLIVHRNCMNVKNYEGSEISLHLQANKLIFHSFMDTGHSFWLRDKGQCNCQTIAVARVTWLVPVSWAPVPTGQCNEGQVTSSHSVSCITGEPQISEKNQTSVRKLGTKLSNTGPSGRHYLYYPGQQTNLPSSP